MFRRAYTPHTAPHLASSSPTSRPTIQASAVHGAESFFLLSFSFVCRPPLCVRAGPRVHGHAARMCEDKSERAAA